MSDLLLRRVPQQAAGALKHRAVNRRRSASAEAARVLEEFARPSTPPTWPAPGRMSREEMIAVSNYWRQRLSGRDLGEDSTAMTRHDRDTDYGRN